MINVLLFKFVIALLFIYILLSSFEHFFHDVLSRLSKIGRFADLDPVWPSIYLILNQRFDKLNSSGSQLEKVRKIIIAVRNLRIKGLSRIKMKVSGEPTEWVNAGEKVEKSNT